MKEGFICIQSWMREELNLSGNELLVYAVIYGFSQDGTSTFSGSRQYLADWCGCSIRNVQNILNSLTERGLLNKTEEVVNNIKRCSYSTVRTEDVADFTGEKISPPREKISLNNIADNIEKDYNTSLARSNTDSDDDVESKGYSPQDLKEEFVGSIKRNRGKKVQKRTSLYDKCEDAIVEYTKNIPLQTALRRYLPVRLAIREKPMYGVNQWKALLNRLDTFPDDEKVEVVNQSAEKAWCSFYPLKSDANRAVSEYNEVSCEQEDTTEEERRAELRKKGRREVF